MNVDMLLSLSSDIQSNIKMASSKSDSDFLSVLDLELNSEDLESIVNEDEKIDEQVLQMLSLLLTKINTNEKLLDEKETTDIPIKNEIKENSEIKKLKDIVLTLSADIERNIDIVSNKSEAEFLSVLDKELDNEELATIFKQDTQSKNLINQLMSVNELYKTNKTENNNDNNINSLSNTITNIIENLYVNNEVENKDYISKLITEIVNKNVTKENNELSTLSTTKEILFEVKKFKNSTTYTNEFLESSSDELNILNRIAFSDNKNIQLQESKIISKYELEVNTKNYKELESNNIGNLNEQIKIIDDITMKASIKESNNTNRYELSNDLDLANIINVLSNSSNTKTEEINISQPVIRGEYIANDVVQTVKYLKNNNFEELSVKMNPKELGEINIKLLKIDGEEKCVITLSNEDTFNLLKDNINEIKNHLSILDIKVKEISIEIRNENQNDFSDSLNQHSNKNNTKEEKKNSNKVVIEDIDNYLENEDININLLV